MSTSVIFHRLFVTHLGDTALLLCAIIIAVRALYYRTFIDESESAPSEVANDERGIKPTLVTRVLMVSVMLAVAGFAIWRLSKP
jgi:hypothetical protein